MTADRRHTPAEGKDETFAASCQGRTGKRRRAPISEALFESVRVSDEGLGNILDIEEAYEINLGNYIDFERGVTAQLATELVHPAMDYEQIDHARRTIGRMLDNLLGTAFSFLEQTRRRMRRLGGRELFDAFAVTYEAVADRLPVLLVMEAIRDHAQHDGSGVSGITLGHRRLEEGDEIVIERTLVASVRRDLITPNRNWPKDRQRRVTALLDEMVDGKGRIEMGPMVRRYIEALSEVLVAARALVARQQADWSQANRDALTALDDPNDEGFNHQVVRLQAVRAVESSPIVHFNVERIARLQKRNGLLTGLPRARIRS